MARLFFSITLLLLTTSTIIAQSKVDSVIAAEQKFAAFALAHGTKQAFLQFMDSADAVVFNDGKILNAFTTWSKRAPNTDVLAWQPAFAGIAQSGELGFTTGPWVFKHKQTDSALAAGCFTTVWHVNDKGEWKFLVDIGTETGSSAYTFTSVKKWTGATLSSLDNVDALTIDRQFIQQYASLHNQAYNAVVTNDSWLNLPGQPPVTGTQNILASLQQIPAGIDFNPMGGGVSSSGDLVYVYGIARKQVTISNYLRIWQKKDGKYTILVQVLQ